MPYISLIAPSSVMQIANLPIMTPVALQEAQDASHSKRRPASAPSTLSRPVRPSSPWVDTHAGEGPGAAALNRQQAPEEPPARVRHRHSSSGALPFQVGTPYHI